MARGRIDLGKIDPYKIFEISLKQSNIVPKFEREYKFHPIRRWKVDFAWPEKKLAVEIEGGIWANGKYGHTRGSGFFGDMQKYNSLAANCWYLLRFTPQQVDNGEAIQMIERWFLERND